MAKVVVRKLPPPLLVSVRFRVNHISRDGVATSEIRQTLASARRHAEEIVATSRAWPVEAQIIKEIRRDRQGDWQVDGKFRSIKVVPKR